MAWKWSRCAKSTNAYHRALGAFGWTCTSIRHEPKGSPSISSNDKNNGLQDRCSCEAAPRTDTTPDVYIIKVAPRRFFKPLWHVVPHFSGACQNHRSGITHCLARESKGLNFRFADNPGTTSFNGYTRVYRCLCGETSYRPTSVPE